MELISVELRELTPSRVEDAFLRQQSIMVRDAIGTEVVRSAHEAFKSLMQDADTLLRYPFDPRTRLGYTPPGVETLQRGSKNPDRNRSMFDVGPGLLLDDPSVAALYGEAKGVCEQVLSFLDEAFGTSLALLPKGAHTLRTAQYLLSGTTSADVLFPRHRDFSLLTAFIGTGVGGLEVEAGDGWEPVTLGSGDVLVAAGTPLTQFLPDVHPLWHRVVGGSDYRLSSFLFFDLGSDVVLPKTSETYGEMLARVLSSIRT